MPELADGVTYMQLANEALTTRGQAPRYSQETIDRTASGEDPYVYPNVNWLNEVFEKWGYNRQAAVNANGGSATAKYYVSLGYYDETGLFATDALSQYNSETKFSRYNVTTNLTLDLSRSTRVDVGIQGYLSDGNYPGVSAVDIFSQAMLVPPVEYPVMYPGGIVPGRNPNGDQRNPYADVTQRGYQEETKNQLYSNITLKQNLDSWTEGLSASAMLAFDAYNEHVIRRDKRVDTYIVDATEPRNPDGTLNLGTLPTYTGQNFLSYGRANGGTRKFYTQANINYDRFFGKHYVTGLLLYNREDFSNAFASDFTLSIPFRYEGLAGRATYSYDDRYFIEFNVGYNGSENFAPSNRYGFFPAIGAGWLISNEKFFAPLAKTIDFLKIRYTDGKVGSSNLGAWNQISANQRFLFIGLVSSDASGYTYGPSRSITTGIVESTYAVNVTWAESRKQDLGLDLHLLNSKFNVVFDLFKEKRTGLFLTRGDVPNFVGLTSDPYGNF